MLFDAHTHIHFPVYDREREAVIKRAQKAGVKMLCVGTQAETSASAIALAEKYPKDIWAAVGFHPNHVAHAQRAQTSQTERGLTLKTEWYHDKKEQREAEPPMFNALNIRKMAEHSKVVAIGECGLDYYRLATSDLPLATRVKERQKEVFLEQAGIAKDLNKALMIHCRPSKGTDDAYEDLLGLISNDQYPIFKIVHFYNGSPAITEKLVNAGFYFTFGGVITFARDYDESIKLIPLERILLETDAPYVAPEPYRGKRNEPAYIVETAKKMAELKGVSLEELSEATTQNASQIFKIELK